MGARADLGEARVSLKWVAANPVETHGEGIQGCPGTQEEINDI